MPFTRQHGPSQKVIHVAVNKTKKAEMIDNLFAATSNYALVHCVAAYFRIGTGIAVKFRRCFEGRNEFYNTASKYVKWHSGAEIIGIFTKKSCTDLQLYKDFRESTKYARSLKLICRFEKPKLG